MVEVIASILPEAISANTGTHNAPVFYVVFDKVNNGSSVDTNPLSFYFIY